VIFVAFKAIDPALRESGGGFDSHTLPPKRSSAKRHSVNCKVPRRSAGSVLRLQVPSVGSKKLFFTDDGSFSVTATESYTYPWNGQAWRQK
jgi:hypothetical protein